MYEVRGRLEPEVGVMLMRAIEMASDALYRRTGRSEEMGATRRWADAVGLLAERAMAVGFGEADVSAETCRGAEPPVSGSRAERYQVVLHVDARSPGTSSGEGGSACMEDGTRVSAEASHRLACDAAVVELARGPDGAVLDVGRRRRTVPSSIRRALDARDRGCRFPGCGLRFTDAHHIRHWADGGATSLDNLVLLCRFHHRLVHEEGFRVEWAGVAGGAPTFSDPRGRPLPDWPSPARLPGHPAEALVRAHVRAGIDPGALTASARWKSQPDIPWSDYARALEALERADERGPDGDGLAA
jgi:hypothetical protein